MYSRVYVEITNICNKNCSFCPSTSRTPYRMTFEEFKTVLKKLKGVTEYIYLHVMGEPLTHPDISKFIRYGADEGFKVAITTNGTLLDKFSDEILDAGVYKVNISVHSFENGTNDTYLEYIGKCLDFADKASSIGVLTVLRLWNEGFDNGKNETTLKLIREKFGGEFKKGSRGFNIRHRLHLEYGERFEWPDMNADFLGESVFCYGLKDHFGILCDGSIVPCCLDREGDITLGNIYKDELNEVLNSKRALAIREGFKRRSATEELCKRCGYARRFG